MRQIKRKKIYILEFEDSNDLGEKRKISRGVRDEKRNERERR